MFLKRKKIQFFIFGFISLIVISIAFVYKFSLDQYSIPVDQWALENKGQSIRSKEGKKGIDINITKVWKITKGTKDVKIGVLDSGIDINSHSIKESIYTNKNENSDSRDNDKNNYIDDINGWDFYYNDNSVYDDILQDYHGTYITSIIAGSHSKESNIYGVAPNVTIVPLKFMRGSVGDVSDAVKAIEYAHKIGVNIINCSWNIETYSKELYNTMKKYKDILFVCAAGNSNLNLDEVKIYPASFELENVISVMAIDNNGKAYKASGYGKSIDVAAPGVDILCEFPESKLTYVSGTSAATAYISGIASLILSYDKGLDSNSIATIIEKSVVDKNGVKLIDAYKCLTTVNHQRSK